MLFERIESPGLAHYSYLIGAEGRAVVIDPRRDGEVYVEKALAAGMQITDVLETHRHEDFAVGSVALAARTGATIWHADPQLPYEYGEPAEDGQTWALGPFLIKALHTPGHTEGSRSYVLHEVSGAPWMVFTGDVLFMGEVGRVDFLGMDRAPEMAGHLYDSIFGKLLPLGDGVLLCPAHGYGSACGSTIAERSWSTLGLERALNPRLRFTGRADFIEQVAHPLPKPLYFEKMELFNIQGPPALDGLPVPASLTPEAFAERAAELAVIDTRDLFAFSAGHVPGALSMTPARLPGFVGWTVGPDEPVLLVLGPGQHPLDVVRLLVRQGYDEVVGFLAGGMDAWASVGLPVAETPLIAPAALAEQLDAAEPPHLLDVRGADEVAGGTLSGAQHIGHKFVGPRSDEVPEGRPVIAYCGSGPRSMLAASVLQREGRDMRVLLGGFGAWVDGGFPVV